MSRLKEILYKKKKTFVLKKMYAIKIGFLFILLLSLAVVSNGKAQTVNLKFRNAPIYMVLTSIKKQTGYRFIYQKSILKKAKPVSVNLKEVPLDSALHSIFLNQPLEYQIDKGTIVIRIKTDDVSTLFNSNNNQEKTILPNKEISGKVTDQQGNPLVGVTVAIKGANKGTITDDSGAYKIDFNQDGNVLIFSMIGFQDKRIEIKGEQEINVRLVPTIKNLDEVVAIGYGTVKKSDLTGAVTSIKAEDLKKTPAFSVDQALEGRAAGVIINSNSGQPGAPATVRIRGIGTVNNSSPIYVVDGVIVNDISFLSPNDVASLEVLKDASATAIYGSRGANGVILITTKKGKPGETDISFNSYVGFQNRWNKLDLMKSKEFAKKLIDIGRLPLSGDDHLLGVSEQNFYKNKGFNSWLKAYRLGNSSYYPIIKSSAHPNGVDYSKVETDWQDEVFKKNAPIQNYYLSVSGGSEKSSYSISGSYFDQDGTIIGSNYKRLTIRVNSQHQIRNWLKVGENISFAASEGRNAMNNNLSPGASILSAAIAMAPWDPTHYPQGAENKNGKDLSGQISASSNFQNVVNPFSMVENSHPSDKNERIVGDVYIEITPFEGLTFRSDVNIDKNNNRNKLFKDKYEYSSYDKAEKNYLSSSMARAATLHFKNILTYRNTIGKNNFSVMVGQTTEEYKYYSISGSGASILNPREANWYLSQTTDDRTYGTDGVSRTRMLSFLSRIQYAYNSKYLATLNFRADGSSKFPENAWGYFPSAALAWKINEEKWLSSSSKIDLMKLRVGYGQIGNEKINVDNFTLKMFNEGPSFVDYVLGKNQQLADGATILTYVNEGGKWEVTEQYNVGVDFGLFKSKFTGSIDFFVRNTKDMLLTVKAPAHVGNRYDPVANVGTVQNKGAEMSFTFQDTKTVSGKPFYFNITGNVSFVKNELTALNGGQRQRVIGTYTISDEGLPLNSLWGYHYLGIYQSNKEALDYLSGYTKSEMAYHAGDSKYEDLNHDGEIDDKDQMKIGNPFPWLSYGLNLSANWMNFDVSIFFQGIYGNQIFNALRYRLEGPGLHATLSTTMRNSWNPVTNPNGIIPNPINSVNGRDFGSGRVVENGAYLRLKNVQIGYTFPLNIEGLGSCRFYLAGNNLITMTKYTGYDPEVGGGVDFGNYPQSRTVMVGVNLNF